MNKTIARIGYAMITEESTAGTTYENEITYLESSEAGGREIKTSPKGDTIEIDADGILAIGGEINSGYDHELTTLDIIDDLKEKWLGRTPVTGGNVEFGGAVTYPKFALVVAEETFRSEKKYDVHIYLNSQVLERPERTAKSNYQKFDPEFPTFKIGSRPRMEDKVVCIEISADELPTAVPTITVPTQNGSGSSGSGSGSSGSGSGSSGSGSGSSGSGT